MPRKEIISYEEFSRGSVRSEKRARERDEPSSDRRQPHAHTVRVFCSCCDREIDLRTVHCGDCCDEDAQRKHGNSATRHRQRESDRRKENGGSLKTADKNSTKKPERRDWRENTGLVFLPEGHQGTLHNSSVRSLGAEEALAQARALEDSEADLIDLSLAPVQSEY